MEWRSGSSPTTWKAGSLGRRTVDPRRPLLPGLRPERLERRHRCADCEAARRRGGGSPGRSTQRAGPPSAPNEGGRGEPLLPLPPSTTTGRYSMAVRTKHLAFHPITAAGVVQTVYTPQADETTIVKQLAIGCESVAAPTLAVVLTRTSDGAFCR